MAKKIVAVTDIMHDNERTNAGEVLDAQKFTKEQLTRFYDRGVIRIVDDSELAPSPTLEDVKAEEEKNKAAESGNKPAENKKTEEIKKNEDNKKSDEHK